MRPSEFSDPSVDPSAIQRLSAEQQDRLAGILDRYLSSLESGAPLSREDLLRAHPELAEPLEGYLQSLDDLHAAAAAFAGAPHAAEPAADATADEKRLGDFKLLREIGRGGMGVVYEAWQISLGRRVALKTLPFAAVLDGKQVARFKNEAQAAAQLHHPNIVSVYAVGVDRGVHYYAMQFIDGQPLDRAIAELREAADQGPGAEPDASCGDADNLNVAHERGSAGAAVEAVSTRRSCLSTHRHNRSEYCRTVVRLGVQAAEALHAAHEYGIVHRDVKPSNLILDGDGNVWITDFGLARCQTDAAFTRTGELVGTTRYMSPEQARGQSALVDHRTDVYSLGATLYELLALEPAFPGDDGPALLRRIDQEEPRRLRRLQPALPADLETVVAKAMAKRREDRYATAQELADDLRRVLECRPTLARPPGISDRFGKWARRHRRLVAGVIAVAFLAAIGMTASTLLIAREKNKARLDFLRAERNLEAARATVDYLGAHVAERLADVPGTDQIRGELLQETLRYYKDFVKQAQDDPSLRADLALTYSKIGDLSGRIGSNEEAIAAHRSAVSLYEQLAAGAPEDVEYRRRLALSLNNQALVLGRVGRTDDARRAYREAIRLQEGLLDEAGDRGRSRSDLALSHNNLGLLESATGDAARAETFFREAIRLQELVLADDPESSEYLRSLAASLNNLGELYLNDQPQRAAQWYEQVVELQSRAAAARPGALKFRSDLALAYNNLGAAQSRAKQVAEAAAAYEKAIAIQRELARVAPAQKSYRSDLAVSLNNLALAETSLGRVAEAEQSYRQALELLEFLVAHTPEDPRLRSSLGGIYNNLGMAFEKMQRYEEAAASFQSAVTHQQFAHSQAPAVSRYRDFLSNHYSNYGRVLRRLRQPDEATRVALARRELWPGDPERLLGVAEELALASRLRSSSTRAITPEQCAGYAVDTLREARAAGWNPPPEFYRTEPFASLRSYPGFSALVNH